MIYRNRLHFAAVIRKARAEGTLTSYSKQREWRTATIKWRWHLYEPAYQSMLLHERERDEYDGREYADQRDEREERLC